MLGGRFDARKPKPKTSTTASNLTTWRNSFSPERGRVQDVYGPDSPGRTALPSRVGALRVQEDSAPAEPLRFDFSKVLFSSPHRVSVDGFSRRQAVQAKLEVGPVEDPLEKEADRVADRVLRVADLASAASVPSPSPMNEGESQVARGAFHADASDAGEIIPAGPGRPLDGATRADIEGRFGRDFGDVRIHDGAPAAVAARSIRAQAYTVGNDIVFGDGKYAPGSHGGRKLLVHELAHVVQQGRAPRLGEAAERPALQEKSIQRKEDEAQTKEDKNREETTSDLDAILRAGKQERESPPNSTETMLRGASIAYRILRVFLPELLDQWWVSGAGGSVSVKGLKLLRSGAKNVSITVGRDFILQTDDAHLQDRVEDVRRAFQSIESNEKGTPTETMNRPTVDRAQAIEEGGKLFAEKAQFGLTAGSGEGPDAEDGYDARYWKEEGRSLITTVEPWLAMSQLAHYLGEEVPTLDGRKTHWHFDCFEGMDVVRKYADWRTTPREEFNQKNNPLRLGFNAYLRFGAADLGKPIRADNAHDKPYTLGAEKATMKNGVMAFETARIPAGASMAQVLEDAPAGSWICWTNADVTRRLAAHEKLKSSGAPISSQQQELIDRITPWNNENAVKIGHDRYSAFPFGVVGASEIVKGMSEIVFQPASVPAGYIEKNIYISSVVNKKPGS